MKTRNSRIEQIVKASRRYGRKIINLECRFDSASGDFHYSLRCAKAGSGSRGGRRKSCQFYILKNLTPDQRERLISGIGMERGVPIPA